MAPLPINRWQAEWLQRPERVSAAIAGRSAGKTRGMMIWKVKRRLTYKASIGLSGASTHDQTRLSTMKHFLTVLGMAKVPFEVDKRPKNQDQLARLLAMGITDFNGIVTLPNDSIEIFRTLSNYEAVRGYDIADIGLDEARELEYQCLQSLSPCLRGFGNIPYQIRIATSPNGFDWVYQALVDESSERFIKGSHYVCPTSHANAFNPPDFIDRMKSILTAEMYEQEIMARFINPQGAVWKDIDPARAPLGNLIPWTYDEAQPVEIGIDWGYRSPAVVLFQTMRYPREWGIVDSKGNPLEDVDVIIDEYLPSNVTVEKIIAWLEQRRTKNPYGRPYRYGFVAYDPAGHAINDQSGVANMMIMSNAGFDMRPMPSSDWVRRVASGVQIVGSRWCNVNRERRLYIACKPDDASGKTSLCPKIWNAVRTYSYKEAKDDRPLDDSPQKGGVGAPDHGADAIRYHQLTKHWASSRIHESRY